MQSIEDFQIQQIKQHAIIDSQFENIFTWRKEMALPSFEKLEKKLDITNKELDSKIEKTNDELKVIDNKLLVILILNILLLVFVVGKIAPELLKALVAVL